MFKRKLALLAIGILLVGTMMVGCTKGNTEKLITVSGSTSVGPLVEAEAEAYKSVNSNVGVEVNQLGTSAGIKNVIEGISELGMASRDLKPEEEKAGVKEKEIAFDGIAVITNKKNPIKNLSLEQVKDIYTGKITNWKDVGGEDAPIVIISREDGSGTRAAFEEIMGYKANELIKDATIADGSGNIKSMVNENENAIGYMSFGYLDDSINALTIDNIEPKAENVKNGTYKSARSFLIVFNEETLTEDGKGFIDYILSENGQKIVKEQGLITIK